MNWKFPSMSLVFLCFAHLAFAEDGDVPDPRNVLTETHEEERSLLRELQVIDEQREILQAEVSTIEEKKTAIRDRKSLSEAQLVASSRDLQIQKQSLRKKVEALYMLRKRGLARLIFGSEDPTELRRRSTYLMYIINAAAEIMNDYKSVVDKHSQALSNVESDVEALSSLEAEYRLKEAALQDQRVLKMEFLKDVRSRRATALQLLAEVSQSQYNLQQRLIREPSQPTNTNFKDLYGNLDWPVKGNLFRRFGRQNDPLTGETINSLGIDIQASFGTPIRVVADGVISLAQFIPAYGQTVAVEHGSYSTVYAHMNGIRVKLGQKVKSGSVLGLVGNTGLTDENNGYLLSFEIRYNRTPQDPLPWLTPR